MNKTYGMYFRDHGATVARSAVAPDLRPEREHRQEGASGRSIRLSVALVAALAIGVVGAQPAHADPLTPLTPAEIAYLDHAHLVFAASHDPVAFRSDGELLDLGRFACDKRAAGFVGTEATFVTPALTQLAFIYLCP